MKGTHECMQVGGGVDNLLVVVYVGKRGDGFLSVDACVDGIDIRGGEGQGSIDRGVGSLGRDERVNRNKVREGGDPQKGFVSDGAGIYLEVGQ